MNQIDRDFRARPEEERAWMLENTWCDRCGKADLGMDSPRENEVDRRIYMEGNCRKCVHRVRYRPDEASVGSNITGD